MKPHIKVIQRNGIDIFVTSNMEIKQSRGCMANNTENNAFPPSYGRRAQQMALHYYHSYDPRQTSGFY
jgi:hypothetical protein